MAESSQQINPLEVATLPLKRKRGRPRKDDFPGSESGSKNQRQGRNPIPTSVHDVVGQPVAGILDGVFDAGFLITVRVGNNGPLLRGMVFDQRLSIPISEKNDIVPHMKMSKSTNFAIPISVEPLQRRVPGASLPVTNNTWTGDGNQGSKDVISKTHLAVKDEELPPASIQVSDHQIEGLAGGSKLDSTGQGSQPHLQPSGDKSKDGEMDGSTRSYNSSATAAPPSNSEILQETEARPIATDFQ